MVMGSSSKKIYTLIAAVFLAVVMIASCITDVLAAWDNGITDRVYTKFSGVDPAIKIIAVDEDTLTAYGPFTSWSREKTADLLELLSSDEYKPSVVGVDFSFFGETGTEADEALANQAALFDNIVFSGNVVYRGITEKGTDGKIVYNAWHADYYEKPYDALLKRSANGFTNAFISEDGYLRTVKFKENAEGETVNSFAYEVYSEYMKLRGEAPKMPKTTSAGFAEFIYSGEVGEYPVFSMKNVMDGKIPGREFKDCIVLIGAYASGMQDAYAAAGDRGNPMNGVEVQANIIQALMQNKTVLNVNNFVYLLFATLIFAGYMFVANKQKLVYAVCEGVALIVAHLFAGRLICSALRLSIPQIYFVICMVLAIVYFIIEKYFVEKIRAKKTVATFKKFVAPEVVDELAKRGELAMVPGGTKRDIAVLFVDIRGFTTMSEALTPEEVVVILNEYLAHTTKCVFDNRGTLDKFVGDCTMAVFNAPFDQEDYIFKAVKTAIDIQKGAKALSEKLLSRYGRTVNFGVGVNCGEAVVGNIGCETRMDYTAIGDTVNTSARLEARAAAGQILVSAAVYNTVKDRVEADYIGEMELKGKAQAISVYNITGLKA